MNSTGRSINELEYCIVDLLKVFGRKDRNASSTTNNSNYLSNHFSDVRAARSQAGRTGSDAARMTFQKQKELEKLLMKAENEDIGMLLKH